MKDTLIYSEQPTHLCKVGLVSNSSHYYSMNTNTTKNELILNTAHYSSMNTNATKNELIAKIFVQYGNQSHEIIRRYFTLTMDGFLLGIFHHILTQRVCAHKGRRGVASGNTAREMWEAVLFLTQFTSLETAGQDADRGEDI